VIHLTLEDVLHIGQRALGQVDVRDLGLLDAAVGRPQASAFGEEAYRDIHEKAAALLQSIARNHALVDGNKRLALASVLAFYGMNSFRARMSNDEAYDLVMAVATGQLEDIPVIAGRLRQSVTR
jgi:death-on-curing protein